MPRKKRPYVPQPYESPSRMPLGWARRLLVAYHKRHPENFRLWSNRRLALEIGVSHTYVGMYKREMGVDPHPEPPVNQMRRRKRKK